MSTVITAEGDAPTAPTGESPQLAPGSVVVCRDEEWLVTHVDPTADGPLLTLQGLSELVRGTSASFYSSLDGITVLDPRAAQPRADDSPHYRKARLWLESTIRKTTVPLDDQHLVVSHDALADPLEYQFSAVRKALSPDSLRPRILLADAVGLGKTLEIGMILAELIRRGRGERILIVCPRHVLEQTQNEMWSRFDIPFVRLDSVGVQRVRQKLPANRNPFTYFKRVIISMDTLKQDRFARDLRQHRWDAVVIDESHNVTNSTTQNNRLASILAPNTDALILASATPHNGKKESFAELIRLLEPTAVTPQGDLVPDELARLVVRRHRNSPEVSSVVGANWAKRQEPQNRLVDASGAENAVADELSDVWLHAQQGTSPYSGNASTLFPWTLAKAFLSSPAALRDTIDNRLSRLRQGSAATSRPTAAQQREADALTRLRDLNEGCLEHSAKYAALREELARIGISRNSSARAVVFAERVPTLTWLQKGLCHDLHLRPEQVPVLHGGMTDTEQQAIVESFKQKASPIKVLVTGDVASEGVNLHLQCHELIHYDIPWSLIRIEQRNGRIDRYGQHTPPRITTLLLQPSSPQFSGDVHVLTRLLGKEHEAHSALGDAASLMGHYSVEAEEDAITRVLAGKRDFDEAVHDPSDLPDDSLAVLLNQIGSLGPSRDDEPGTPDDAEPMTDRDPLYPNPMSFLREAIDEEYTDPDRPADDTGTNGVGWREHPDEHLIEFTPPADLRQRLEVLPDSYLRDRGVLHTIKLATTKSVARAQLRAALDDTHGSSWPEAHYLGPLHPVLDWAADRCLAKLSRNEIFVVRGAVDCPTVLLAGTLVNRRGQVISATWVSVEFPLAEPGNPGFAVLVAHSSASEMLSSVGFGADLTNTGPVPGAEALQPLIPAAVDRARQHLDVVAASSVTTMQQRLDAWSTRTATWQHAADEMPVQFRNVARRRTSVDQEQEFIALLAPDRQLVRPLLVVVPTGSMAGADGGR